MMMLPKLSFNVWENLQIGNHISHRFNQVLSQTPTIVLLILYGKRGLTQSTTTA